MRPGLFEVEWRSASLKAGKPGATASNGIHRSQIQSPRSSAVDTELRTTSQTERARFDYRLTPQSELRLNSLNVTLILPSPISVGGTFLANGKEAAFSLRREASLPPKGRPQTPVRF